MRGHAMAAALAAGVLAGCAGGTAPEDRVSLDRALHDSELYEFQGPLAGRNEAVRNLATTQPEPYD